MKDIERLSAEQCAALIKDLGPIAILVREFNAKSLMQLLPGLTRDIALILVSAKTDTRGATEDPVAKTVCQLLIRNQPTAREITTMLGFCLDSEFGTKCFRTAVGYYYADPVSKGKTELADSLLLRGLLQQEKAEAAGETYSDEQVQQDIEAEAERAEERLRLREWLRDEYNIESRQDYAWMLDALRCVCKANQGHWQRASRADLNLMTRKARRLYERAKAYPCRPSAVVEWDEQKRKGLQPNVIYKRPDGVKIWGTNELVVYDAEGAARRPQETIFGKTMPDGTVPMDFEMNDLVDKAYPKEEPEQPETED